MNWLFMAGALACGVVLTTQVATNKQLGEHRHDLYIPAVVNMIVGFVATVAVTLMLSKERPTTDMVKTSPWYGWLAGGALVSKY